VLFSSSSSSSPAAEGEAKSLSNMTEEAEAEEAIEATTTPKTLNISHLFRKLRLRHSEKERRNPLALVVGRDSYHSGLGLGTR
jgi:hypothetical protein